MSHKAHLWRLEDFSFYSIYTSTSAAGGPGLRTVQYVILPLLLRHSWLAWIKSFGGELRGSYVWVDDRLVLHHAL
eukprot:6455725-Amphidinium_carterae.3